VIAFARFEIRRTLRDSRFLVFLVAMPALLYRLLAGFDASRREDGLPAPAVFMVAMMCYAAIGSACYAIGPPLAAARARGCAPMLDGRGPVLYYRGNVAAYGHHDHDNHYRHTDRG